MSLLGSIVLLSIVLAPIALQADPFTARVFTDTDGKTLPYRLLIPADYKPNSSTKYPVILFFHGAGERGVDNNAQLRQGVPNFTTADDLAKYPAIIIAPQCPADKKWVDMDWTLATGIRPSEPTEPMRVALKILDSVVAEFGADKDRIYVMGLSMGGFGTWDCVTRFPERFAAAVPICGGGDEATVTAAVAKVPVWAFGSSDDTVVPPLRTLHMVEAMVKLGGTPRYYFYSGLGHGSWGKGFSEPELLPWLFSQRLSARVPAKP